MAVPLLIKDEWYQITSESNGKLIKMSKQLHSPGQGNWILSYN